MPTSTVVHEWRPDGLASHARGGNDGGGTAPLVLFGLYDWTTTTVKVRGFGVKDWFCLAGVWTNITGGGEELDTAITISAAAYIYIKLHRASAGQTVTLEQAAAKPGGDADDEPYLLWYIGWDSTNSVIDRSDIRDLQKSQNMTAMA